MSHEWIPIEESPFLYCVGMANFKLPALVSGFLCRQTTLWLYGIMFALAVTKNMIQTNTGALKPPNPYMVTKVQGPSVPGILMSKFTRCSHPFLLTHLNSFISQRNRRHPTHHPSPEECSSNTLRHPSLHLISAAQSWFIALFTSTAVPHLSSLSQPLILPQSHPRL